VTRNSLSGFVTVSLMNLGLVRGDIRTQSLRRFSALTTHQEGGSII